MTRVQHDAARVTTPLRRNGAGVFEPVSWDSAIADIADRLDRVLTGFGAQSVGWYVGNPAAFSQRHLLSAFGFMRALGSRQLYSALSQDGGSRFAASALLYGDPAVVGLPDLEAVDLLLIIGANPFVSNGSQVVAPDIRRRLRDVTARGGRIVVIDPRRTETARAFEHLAIRPGTDAWLLAALLRLMLTAGNDDRLPGAGGPGLREFGSGEREPGGRAVAERGLAELNAALAPFSVSEAARRTGIEPSAITALADALSGAPHAAVYGRTGTCTSAHGTLVTFLMDALNIVTGNLGPGGGVLLGWLPWPMRLVSRLGGLTGYDRYRSRVGGRPEVMGFLPAAGLGTEIATGGVRALIVSAGNPAVSVPGGRRLGEGLRQLDLHVSIDLYVNDSNREADYILPSTTWLERPDSQLTLLPFMPRPFAQFTRAVVAPRGESREEQSIIRVLLRALRSGSRADRMRRRAVAALLAIDLTALARLMITAAALVLRPGSNRRDVVVLRSRPPRRRLRRVNLAPPPILRELARMRHDPMTPDADFPLLLIGRREAASLNSWLHCAPTWRGAPRLLVSGIDAANAGVADGDRVTVASATGALVAVAEVTSDLAPGVVCLPHGWSVVNVNEVTSDRPEATEALAGMARLNAVAVRIGPA